MQRIKKGDMVTVIAGREKGKQGRVLRVIDGKRVVVEKLNTVKRHQRPTQQQQQGGIIEKEAPLDLSNVMLLSPKSNVRTRVGFKFIEGEGGTRKKVRYCKKTDEILD